MAQTKTPKTPPTPAPAPEPPAPNASATTDAPFSWDSLQAPVAMPNKVAFTGIKANVISTVAAPIRQRAELSLAVNAARVKAAADSTAKRARVNYHWDIQPVPSVKVGEDFAKAITKYAKYRPIPAMTHAADCGLQGSGLDKACTCPASIPFAHADSPTGQVTARCGEVAHYRKNDAGDTVACTAGDDGAFIGIRYSVRPFEQRATTARVPGTE